MKKYLLLVICGMSVFIGFSQFVPNDSVGLAAWYRSDSVHMTGVGNTIDTLYDLSGNSLHAYQLSGSQTPDLILNEINSFPVVRFNSATDMDVDNLILEQARAYTIIAIVKNTHVGNSVSVFMELSTDGTNSSNFGIPAGSFQTSYGRVAIGSRSNQPFALIRGDNVLNSGFNYLSLEYLGVDPGVFGNYTMVGNNSSMNLSTGQNFAANNRSKLGSTVGNFDFQGDIVELMIFDTLLSASDSVQIQEYIKSRYIPELDLGADKIKQTFCTDTLVASSDSYSSYLWNNGSTNDTLFVDSEGIYSVIVTDIFGFTSVDTI